MAAHTQPALRVGRCGVGFYGLDWQPASVDPREVISYLDKVDPRVAARARARRVKADHARADDASGVRIRGRDWRRSVVLEREAVGWSTFSAMRALAYARQDGLLAEDELF